MNDVKLPTEKMVVLRGALKGDWYTAAQMLAIHEQGRLAGLEDALDAIASNGCESAGDCVVVIRALAASDGGNGNG
jgi:hypothetical protein